MRWHVALLFCWRLDKNSLTLQLAMSEMHPEEGRLDAHRCTKGPPRRNSSGVDLGVYSNVYLGCKLETWLSKHAP